MIVALMFAFLLELMLLWLAIGIRRSSFRGPLSRSAVARYAEMGSTHNRLLRSSTATSGVRGISGINRTCNADAAFQGVVFPTRNAKRRTDSLTR